MKLQLKLESEGYKDLGWANGWKDTPKEVLSCQQLKHIVKDVDVGPPNCGLHHVVWCPQCGYVYHVDSGD